MVNKMYPVMEGRHVDERETSQYYAYYSLHHDADETEISLLPVTQELVLGLEDGQAVLVDWHTRMFLEHRQFCGRELLLAHALLTSWPSYVPLAKLVALSLYPEAPELVQTWLDHAHAAGNEGSLRQLLRPLGVLIAKCNVQFEAFGLSIAKVDQPECSGEGYRLVAWRQKGKHA
jgi:hypothetical protein